MSFVVAMAILASPVAVLAHESENEAFIQHGGDHDEPQAVVVNQQGQHALGLETGTACYSFLKDTLSATGEVKAAETQSLDVNPPVSGVVQSVYAKQGDSVKKGEVLALDSVPTKILPPSSRDTGRKRFKSIMT